MKRIISVNYKFMEIPPRELLELISKYADGLEVYVDYHKEAEVKYLDEIAALASEYKLSLQIHGESELPLLEQKEFLRHVSQYSNYGGSILVTLHSVYREDVRESVSVTDAYFGEVIDFVNKNCPNLTILIENLNDWDGRHRLKMQEIASIVEKFPDLGVTYDVGHVLADGETDLIGGVVPYMNFVKNIHIHTCRSAIDDHLPIYEGDKNWKLLIDALRYFGDLSVVFEYNVYECRGETIREKVTDYLQTFAPVVSAVSE